MTENTSTQVPTVHQAWAAVMADVRELGKNQRNDAQRFNFRGIDDVMNACGPVLRKHGVAVVPSHVTAGHRDVQTTQGKPSREATVVVTYTVYGPAGDSFTGMAPGESMDSGDKGTPKAMSVAMRTFLLQALCLPTEDVDPDAQTYERGAGPTPAQQAQQVADGLPGCADLAKLQAVHGWSAERNLLDQPVTDANGNSLPLAALFDQHQQRLAVAA